MRLPLLKPPEMTPEQAAFYPVLRESIAKTFSGFDTETSDLRVPFDAGLDKGNASFDRRHVFAMSYVYALPFFEKSNSVARHFLGGWQLSGIVTLQTGQLVSISGGSRATNSPSGYPSSRSTPPPSKRSSRLLS